MTVDCNAPLSASWAYARLGLLRSLPNYEKSTSRYLSIKQDKFSKEHN